MRESLRVKNLKRRLAEQIRLRWAVVLISAVGGGLSIALNVEHAPDNLWARLTGAWPPIAVVITVELVSRIPATNILLAIGRVLVTVGVGGGAFYVSFVQQYDYMLHIGWTGASAWIFPLITDGVVVVALLSMIEVVRAIRTLRIDLDAFEEAEIVAAEIAARAKETETTPPIESVSEPATLEVAEPETEPELTLVVEPETEPEPVSDVKPNGYRRRKTPPRATPSNGIKRKDDDDTATAQTVEPTLDAVVEPALMLVD